MIENTDAYKMVVFDFFKEAMDVETASARLIVCGGPAAPGRGLAAKKIYKSFGKSGIADDANGKNAALAL